MRITRWLAVAGLLLCAAGCGGQAKQEPVEQPKPSEGVQWLTNFGEATIQAKQDGKPMMVDVMASWCGPCKRLEEEVWSRGDVGELSKSFVSVKVDGDERKDLKTKFAVSGYPTTLFLSAEGEEISRVRGAVPYEDMVKAMQGALNKAELAK